ncbi:sensor histidine kinase [Streptosporangium lutulentum]|uniref:histidine kinase n=1 Tax=Streptosporangium lutulentum TaxID=1461250 RepID=A0ABT9Q647_9ACTN|nr:sensor histidine kinase [Streptosporangium lutulentum]MDP9841880.1 signal transduction histidine kinase [Streptosporangium lutulentum]
MLLRDGLLRLARPFAQALVTGKADPPFPRSRRLRPPVPASLGLLPFRTVDLVLLAEILLAWFLFSTELSRLMTQQENLLRVGLVVKRLDEPLLWFATQLITEHEKLSQVGLVVNRLDEPLLWFAAAVSSLPVLLRGRWPLAAWRLAILGSLLTTPITGALLNQVFSLAQAVTYLLVVYSVAVRCARETTLGVWIISVLAVTTTTAYGGTLILVAILLAVPALFGYNVRIRRLASSRLAEEEQRSKRALAAQAMLEERARIARELHDVVAHHMSVIAIQAEAVPLQAAGDAGRLEEGLREIRALSLSAMTEMRRVLGVLRDEDGRTDTAPQPGLGRLEELIGTARSAGLTVSLKLGGNLTGLPTAVSLSAYRIAQESLSNAMRHAPGSTVSVKISRSGAELHLQVANDAGHPSPTEPGHVGHGLIGMRERVSMLGGSLWAGPVGPGFAITAILPIVEKA